MEQSIRFDEDLIKRYNQSGPRYTSYPTAVQFDETFGVADYQAAAERSNASDRNLSLYFHIPFCDTVCFFCACNKVWTRDRSKTTPYLARLYQEIEMQAKLFDSNRKVDQLHWGGGTPTFINMDEMRELMAVTRQHFNLHDDDSGEYSIEIDPREANKESVKLLRELGFNRMSLGVQDFDPKVQKAVNRIQTEAQTFEVLEGAREAGFMSVNVDLIYGLPHQTEAGFMATLDKVLEVAPDRFSIFNYAHMPSMFPTQKKMNEADMPSPDEKLAILHATTNRLLEAGYVYIGMDHFAKPDDELAIAQRNETLYRNFQGYSTHAECDLIGMGATSISLINNTYAQNYKSLNDYYQAIDAGHLAVFRGVELTEDDELRRDVITRLISHFHLNFNSIEAQWGIVFKEYFEQEMNALAPMIEDGLVELSDSDLYVTAAGRLLIRNICMAFDAYLKQGTQNRFSKVI
ncbi:Oxygen-independent coproporphyrinogen III oxidase [Hydrogenovibrio crunogenus]|uniref:Coproporphyrinogen-III oxidase n=1 Tax=Hydrogenovibrio crunogenus TaxID=39765 RepID=A0A4P7NZV2_9GAMM|nr:oxygen-independent coproporphyrinogen III oxidase [Hydrogenovibrio crunogenus]QBZ82502.1 Oxygen-independent coproporphyrinogen III oxidase [Hydrogenovibrio crunogenus]RUM92782.1 MAG: oxygen-independent coproporphyrinogen III oxidase [Thiomicrospira sp.]